MIALNKKITQRIGFVVLSAKKTLEFLNMTLVVGIGELDNWQNVHSKSK